MSDKEKVDAAQKIYDSVLNAFPNIKKLMISTQNHVRKYGYTETILGRRRHLPNMQLPEYDFIPLDGYVNPDIDPLDPSTLKNTDDIPERVKVALYKELVGIKNFGRRLRRIRELNDVYHIKVINNRSKIARASRQCLNCVSLDTEILTVDGWKSYDSVSIGDSIYSYNIDTKSVERDVITNITVSHDKVNVMRFKSSAFESVSTMNHRWVVCESNGAPKIVDTAKICKDGYGDYPILRVGDNNFVQSNNYSDDELKVIGWFLTDGYFRTDPSYVVRLYQTTKRPKNLAVYNDMISTISRLGLQFNDNVSKDGHYHSIYLNKCDFTLKLISDFPNRELTSDFISTLSQSQANIVMHAMLDGDGTVKSNGLNLNITCSNINSAGLFQYLAFIAGYATNIYERTPEQFNSTNSSNKCYDSVSNTNPIKITKPYYIVSVLKRKRAQIWKSHQFPCEVDGVWCPTTNNSTWIARYDGKIFITGNSVVQGSAADQTKLAMLQLDSNPEWNAIGGRVLIPVHDELIAEVPIEHWKRGGQILSETMCEAASFLPFPSKCDVTTSLRWKGLEYPCPYPKPKNLTDLTADEIKWVQYNLCECEYLLPVYEKDGEDLKGDEAVGVNGVISDEYLGFIQDFKDRFHIDSDEDFIDRIEKYVVYYQK